MASSANAWRRSGHERATTSPRSSPSRKIRGKVQRSHAASERRSSIGLVFGILGVYLAIVGILSMINARWIIVDVSVARPCRTDRDRPWRRARSSRRDRSVQSCGRLAEPRRGRHRRGPRDRSGRRDETSRFAVDLHLSFAGTFRHPHLSRGAGGRRRSSSSAGRARNARRLLALSPPIVRRPVFVGFAAVDLLRRVPGTHPDHDAVGRRHRCDARFPLQL